MYIFVNYHGNVYFFPLLQHEGMCVIVQKGEKETFNTLMSVIYQMTPIHNEQVLCLLPQQIMRLPFYCLYVSYTAANIKYLQSTYFPPKTKRTDVCLVISAD